MANNINFFDEEPTQPYTQERLLSDTSKALYESRVRPQRMQQAYEQELAKMSNPNSMPLALNGDYKQAELAVIQDILKRRPTTKEQVDGLIDSSPLLAELYKDDPNKKEAIASSILTRSYELQNGKTPSFNSLLGDVNPLDQVQEATTDEEAPNAFVRTVKDSILKPIDALIGTNFMESNELEAKRSKLIEQQSALGNDTRNSVNKLRTLAELNKAIRETSQRANPFTPEGMQAQADLEQLQQRASLLRDSLTDAEVDAFQKYGKQYVDIENQLQATNYGLQKANPRYQSDVEKDYEEAEHNLYLMNKYGSSKYTDNLSNLDYWKDQMSHEFGKVFGSKAGFINTLEELAPWMLFGMLTGGVGTGLRGLASLRAIVGNALPMLGTGVNIERDAMNAYFEKYGTVEGFNKLQAFVGGNLNYIFNLMGSKMLLEGMPKATVNGIIKSFKDNANDWLKNTAEFINKAGALGNDGIASAISASTRFGNYGHGIFSGIKGLQHIPGLGNKSLAQSIGDAGVALQNTGNALRGLEKGAISNLTGKALNKTGELVGSKISRVGAGLLEGSIKGGFGMSTENATAEMATQWANQQGDIDWDKVLETASAGFPVGVAGLFGGIIARPGVWSAKQLGRAYGKLTGKYPDLQIPKGESRTIENDFIKANIDSHFDTVKNYVNLRINATDELIGKITNEIGQAEANASKATTPKAKAKWEARSKLLQDRLKEAEEYKTNLNSTILDTYSSSIRNSSTEEDILQAISDIDSNESLSTEQKAEIYKKSGLSDKDIAEYKANLDIATEEEKKTANINPKLKDLAKELDTSTTNLKGVSDDLVDKWHEAKTEEDKANALEAINKALQEEKAKLEEEYKNTPVKSGKSGKLEESHRKNKLASLDDLIKRSSKEHRTKLKETQKRDTKADLSNWKDILSNEEQKGIIQDDFLDTFKDSKMEDIDSKYATLTNEQKEALKAKYGTTDEAGTIKAIKDNKAKLDESIKLHNAIYESENAKVYDSKEQIEKDYKKLIDNNTIKIKSVKKSDGTEKYYIVKSEDSQYANLRKVISLGKTDLTGVKNTTLTEANKEFTQFLNENKNLANKLGRALKKDAKDITLEDINKFDKPQEVLAGINNLLPDGNEKAIQSWNSNKKNKSLKREGTYRMRGFSDVVKRVKKSTYIKNQIRHVNEANKMVNSEAKRLGLTGFLNAKSDNNELQQYLADVLFNFGLVNLYDGKNLTELDYNGIVSVLKSKNLSKLNVDQLHFIQAKLNRLVNDANFISGDRVYPIKPFKTAIDNLIAIIDTEFPYNSLPDAKDTTFSLLAGSKEEWNSENPKSRRTNFGKLYDSLNTFNNKCKNDFGLTDTDTYEETNWLTDDTLIDDMFSLLIDPNIVDAEVRAIFNDSLSSGFIGFEQALANVQFPNEVWEYLKLKYDANGSTPSGSVATDFADSTEIKEVKEFFNAFKDNPKDMFNKLDSKVKAQVARTLLQDNVVQGLLGFTEGNAIKLTAKDYLKSRESAYRNTKDFTNVVKNITNFIKADLGLTDIADVSVGTVTILNMISTITDTAERETAKLRIILNAVEKTYANTSTTFTSVLTDKVKKQYESEIKSFVNYIQSLDTFNKNNIRKYVLNSNLPPFLQKFFLNNAGKLWLGKVIAENRIGNNAISDVTTQLRNIAKAYKQANESIPLYTGRQAYRMEDITSDSLVGILDVLNYNGVTLSDVEIPFVTENKKLLLDNNKQFLFDANGDLYDSFSNELLNRITPEDKYEIAKVLAKAINASNIDNTYAHTGSKGSLKIIKPSANNSSIEKIRRFNVTENRYNSLFKPRIKSALLVDDALNAIISANTNSNISEQLNDIVNLIKDAKSVARSKFAVDTAGRHLISQIEAIGDYYNDSYLNVVSAVALASLSGFSTEASEEFLKKLAQIFPNVPIAEWFTKNEVMDLGTIRDQMGKMCANALGYKHDSDNALMYSNLVKDMGNHCVALLHELGYIEVGRLSRADGKYTKADKGTTFANTMPVVKLLNKGTDMKSTINTMDTFTNESGNTVSILDNLLGYTNRLKNPRTKTEFQEYQKELETEYTNGVELDSFGQVGTLTNVKLSHDADNGILKLEGKKKGIKQTYYYSDNIAFKKDGTKVSHLRLAQILANIIEHSLQNIARTKQMFKDLIDATGKVTISEINFDTPEKLAELVKAHPNIGLLIDYKDPNEEQGKFATNINTRNYQALRDLLKTAEFIGNKLWNSTDAFVPMYFDEENTVNNRLFVNNLVDNYRENKMYRNLFEMNDMRQMEFTIGKDRSVPDASNPNKYTVNDTDFLLPILHGFDLGWDKMRPEAISALKDKLSQKDGVLHNAFNTLLQSIDPDKPDTWQKAIDKFNEDISDYAKQGEDKASEVSFNVIKPDYEKNAEKAKLFQIKYNHEAVYTLLKLKDIQIKDTTGKTNAITDIAQLFNPSNTISNYTLRIEVDGTTNGPAIRAMIGVFEGTQDPLNMMLSTGVGLSSVFTNYVDILSSGFLDTYLISGSFSQYNVAIKSLESIVTNNFQDDPNTEILKSIYGLDTTNIVDTLRGIMTRNFMKYPVMYITYSAGRESVSLDFLKLISEQVSKVLAGEVNDNMRKLIKDLVSYNEGYLSVTYEDSNCFLDREGNILDKNRNSIGINIFSNEKARREVSIDLSESIVTKTKLTEGVLDPIYNSVSDALKEGQRVLSYNNLATNQQAFAYNVVLEKLIKKAFTDDNGNLKEYTYIDLMEKAQDIANELTKIFSGIVGIEESTDLSGSELSTFKEALIKDVNTRLSAMTLMKGGSTLILNNKYTSPYLEGLGAGQSPVTVHSIDSYNMTNFQDYLLRNGYGKGLPIHDAMIAGLNQLSAMPELNKIFYTDRMRIAEMCINRDEKLRASLRWIQNHKELLGDTAGKLISQYESTIAQCEDSTQIDVLFSGLAMAELNYEKAKRGDKTFYVNQFSLDESSAYQPTEKDLENEIKAYKELIKKADADKIITDSIASILRDGDLSLKNWLYNHLTQLGITEEELNSRLKNVYYDKEKKFDSEYIDLTLEGTLNKIFNAMALNRSLIPEYLKDINDYLKTGSNTIDKVHLSGLFNIANKKTFNIENTNNRLAGRDTNSKIASAFEILTKIDIGKVLHLDNMYVVRNLYQAILANKDKLLGKGSFNSWDIMNILREAVGLSLGNRLSTRQKEAFEKLLHRFGTDQFKVNLSEFDKTKTTFIDLSSELDWEGVDTVIEQAVNRNNIYGSRADYDKNTATTEWFDSNIFNAVYNYYKDKLKAGDKQIVFTLRSSQDILRMQALQRMIDRAGTEGYEMFQGTSIVVVPSVSDLTRNSPKTDLESELLLRLKQSCNNPTIHFTRGTVKDNVQLLQNISNQDVTESYLIEHKSAYGEKAQSGSIDDSGNYKQIDRTSYSDKASVDIDFTNEVGELRDSWSNETSDRDNRLPTIALETNGIRDRSLQDIDLDDILQDNPENDASYTKTGYKDIKLGSDSIWFDADHGGIGAVFTPKNGINTNAIGINMCSDGSLVNEGTVGLLKDLPEFNSAVFQAKLAMQEDYKKYLNGGITWREYLKPRVIKVTDSLNNIHYYVFQVTRDTSIAKNELAQSVAKSYGQWELVTGTPLFDWLSDEAKLNVNNVRKFVTDNSDSNSDKRVFIDRSLINKNLLEVDNYDEGLKNVNARCLGVIQNKLSAVGINNLAFIHKDNTFDYSDAYLTVPDSTDFSYTFLSLNNISKKAMQAVADEIKVNKRNMFTSAVNGIASVFHAFRRIPTHNKEFTDQVNMDVRNMRGKPANRNLSDMTRDMLNGSVSLKGALNECKRMDSERGVDTNDTELSWLDDLMVNSTTPITLFMDEASNTIDVSQVSLERDEYGVARNEEIILGKANNGESQTEAMRHEYSHTVWRHADPRAKQELTKIFNIAMDNLTLDDFEDGNTPANRLIMDAITNPQTPNHLEEFGAYAVSCPKFRQAIRNMENRIGKHKAKMGLIEKIKNLFTAVITKLMSFISGEYQPKSKAEFTSLVSAVDGIFRSSYKASAKFWQEASIGKDSTVPKEYDYARGVNETPYERLVGNLHNPIEDTIGSSSSLVTLANDYERKGTQDIATVLTDGIREFTSAKFKYLENFASDLAGSIEGASPDMYRYLQIRNQGKMLIDQSRERGADAVNNTVRDILKNVPKEVERELTRQFIRTDISCLFNSTKSAKEVKELLTNKDARAKEIKKLENKLNGQTYANAYKNMAKGLAQYLVTGFNPTGLAYRNAYEIVNLSGSSYQTKGKFNGDTVNVVDQLTTLYALDLIKNPVYDKLDEQVIENLSKVHNGVKDAEYTEVYGNNQQKNHIPKGQLHGGKTTGRYDIIPESELKAYQWNGYEKVSDAELDPFYKRIAKEKYVIVKAKWKSPTPYVAGVTLMTDLFKGRAKSGLSYNGEGKVDKEIDWKRTKEYEELKKYVNQRVNALNKPNPQLLQKAPHGNLVLNFNYIDRLTGANFELNPVTTDEVIGRNQKITSVLGDIYGSCIERSQSSEFNRTAGEAMINIYEHFAKQGNSNQFVWLSDNSESEEYRELYNSLPYDTKAVATEKYGDNGIPVMKKALTTVFGYKQLSANDIDATKEAVKAIEEQDKFKTDLSTEFMNYVKYVFHNGITGNMEEFFKWLASTAKDNIVIKGLTTSWNNLVSNCVTLGIKGLSLKEIGQYQAEAFNAMRTINEWEKQLKALKVKQFNNTYTDADAIKERALKQNIENSPMYPLYKRGIVSNSLAENSAESDKFFKDLIDNITPKGMIRDLAHEFTLSPKGNLYQALFMFANAGDTVAKYALYKHMRNTGFSEEESSRIALQTFIDYSNPLPKSIQYLDSIGVYPFAKYAFGSKSAMLNSIFGNPDRAVSFMALNDLIFGLPNMYEGIFGTTTMINKFNFPGELFVDSLNGLTSVKIANTIWEAL